MVILFSILGFLISIITYWISQNTFTTYLPILKWVTTTGNWSGRGLFIAGLALGVFAVPALRLSLNHFVRSKRDDALSHNSSVQKEGVDGRVYGLEHAILNLTVPPKSMWMNMGYWENDNSVDFSDACERLLDQVLEFSGLTGSKTSTMTPRVKIIDLGFGCGDQTIYLSRLERPVPHDLHTTNQTSTKLFDEYVGITLEKKQFSLAQHRIKQLHDPRIQLFCADAAQPQTWTHELQASTALIIPETTETWLLALDTLYHFIPSRLAIFEHAHDTLVAHVAAFDLLLADKRLTFLQNLILRIVALGSGTPRSNFLTTAQYIEQLVAAGYAAEDVEIRDISEHVFGGLTSFLEKHDGRLRALGWSGIGRFHVARCVFGWWARSGIVRGCIVVAKRKPNARKDRTKVVWSFNRY